MIAKILANKLIPKHIFYKILWWVSSVIYRVENNWDRWNSLPTFDGHASQNCSQSSHEIEEGVITKRSGSGLIHIGGRLLIERKGCFAVAP